MRSRKFTALISVDSVPANRGINLSITYVPESYCTVIGWQWMVKYARLHALNPVASDGRALERQPHQARLCFLRAAEELKAYSPTRVLGAQNTRVLVNCGGKFLPLDFASDMLSVRPRSAVYAPPPFETPSWRNCKNSELRLACWTICSHQNPEKHDMPRFSPFTCTTREA